MFDMFQLRAVAGGKNAALKAELSGFLDAGFRWRYAPNLSGQTDFSEKNRFRIENVLAAARCDSGDDSEIDRRLVDVNAAGNVDENILIEKLGAHFFFKNRDEQ